jgi:hypothetical protein
MSVDPTLAAKVGTLAPTSQDSAVRTIGRGLETAPVLRQGLGVTWLFAALGAGGRVVVPILIQQAIDRGITDDEVRMDVIVQMALLGVVAVLVSGWAFRMASLRLGERSERALHDLRVRLIGHIHQLSLADHNDERRGGLVARVTSDIETLARFFQWGGLAWLVDGTLMVIVAERDARLRLAVGSGGVRRGDPAAVRPAGRAVAAARGVRPGPAQQRPVARRDRRTRLRRARRCAPTAPARRWRAGRSVEVN